MWQTPSPRIPFDINKWMGMMTLYISVDNSILWFIYNLSMRIPVEFSWITRVQCLKGNVMTTNLYFNTYILRLVLEFMVYVVIGRCSLSMYYDDMMKITSLLLQGKTESHLNREKAEQKQGRSLLQQHIINGKRTRHGIPCSNCCSCFDTQLSSTINLYGR